MNSVVRNFIILCFIVLTSCSDNAGIVIGNPNVTKRSLVGGFTTQISSNLAMLNAVSDDTTPASISETCGGLESLASTDDSELTIVVEARSTDLTDFVSAPVENNRFTMSIDTDKAYFFSMTATDQNGDVYGCGNLVFPTTNADHHFQKRAVVAGGTDDIDLGQLTYTSIINTWITETDPAMLSDYDGDEIADAIDDDVNGDGLLDFDGNYDDFINVLDPSDTGAAQSCDLSTIESPFFGEYGSSTLETFSDGPANEGHVTLILTSNQTLSSFDPSLIRFHNVDLDQDYTWADLGVSAEQTADNEETLTVYGIAQNDYLMTIPMGSFSCETTGEQGREINYFFRPVLYSIAVSAAASEP